MSSKSAKAGIGIISTIVLVLVIVISIRHEPAKPVVKQLAIHKVTEQQLSAPETTRPGNVTVVTVKSGDTLANIFDHLKLSAATLEEATASSLANSRLVDIKPGQTLTFNIAPHHDLQQIIYPYNNDSTLYISKTAHGYIATVKSKPVTISLSYKQATIHHSLAEAANTAGLNSELYHQLIEIFQGTIDFKRGIHRGDHFSVLHQEYLIEGRKDHSGNIMAAEFTVGGENYYAFRYTYPKNHTGYYTLSGKGVQPLFLKAPVKYKRISSYFTYHRMDPYLHVMRPHLGIDYAAPEGTPIHSIGNGRVLFAGRDHGYGNAVVIRYSRKYKTLYGHMEKFAKGLHAGEHVNRGQLIGYIGSTGWSTGPHLHFEMYVYGIPRDPLKLKFPGGQSIPASFTQRYHAYAQKMLARLNLYQSAGFAQNGRNKIEE
jgi:murein DD-endopeptidase MepM/ murein hydrolase activator NlpD